MKKLVAAACALAAGMVLADVTSGNTVGFQEDTTVAGFNWYCPPFASIGETSTLTYGDIMLEGDGIEPWGDNIQLLDEQGTPVASFVWDNGWLDGFGYFTGGYMTDEVITRGMSFIIETMNDGVTIKCTGEVSTNAVTFTASSAAGFNWVGNPFPKAMTYGDITIRGANVEAWGDNIQLLDEQGTPIASFVWDDGWLDGFGYVSGGYMTDEEIPAGAGFIIETVNGDVEIAIKGFTF